jgi:hypothetical protein
VTSLVWIVWWLALVVTVGWVAWLGRKWSQEAAPKS